MHLCPTQSIPTPSPETNRPRFGQSKQRHQSNKVADVFIGEPWAEVLKWASGMWMPSSDSSSVETRNLVSLGFFENLSHIFSAVLTAGCIKQL